LGLKRLFGRWLSSAESKLRRRKRRPARGPGELLPWQYPDPFTGEPVRPPNDVDAERLAAAGLPVIGTLSELAAATGLTWQTLLWLAGPSTACGSASPHYYFFSLPKSRGGERLILAPKPTLKRVQRWILEHILNRVPVGDCVHGFRRHRSILSNAEPHCGKEVVARFDLEDFFHTVTYRRVRGLFRSLGYSTEVSVLLGLLTTFRPKAYPYEFMRHVPHLVWLRSTSSSRRCYRGFPTTPPFLPQGAPTSPAIANLVARRLDRRLVGLARRFGADYSRYADDLTFSGQAGFRRDLARFLPLLRRIVREEGFYLASGKQRIRRKGSRQMVTGVVVNRHPNPPRDAYRRLRVLLHKAATEGPTGVYLDERRWVDPAELRHHLEGWVAHISNLNRAKGDRLKRVLARIKWPQQPDGSGWQTRDESGDG